MSAGNNEHHFLSEEQIVYHYAGDERLAQTIAIRAGGRRAARLVGPGTGSLSYAATRQLRALISRFVVKIVDPMDHIASTGFFINPQAMILTCWHVIEPKFAGAVRDWVWVDYQDERYQAQVLKRFSNRHKDLAVLQIRGREYQRLLRQDFEVAPLAFPCQPADPVAALGNQRQDLLTDSLLLRGYIDPDNTRLAVALTNARLKTFATQECLGIVFRHTRFDEGMSGAPLLDTRIGCVVGVVAGVLDNQALFQLTGRLTPEPLGFAIPLREVSEVWRSFASDCRVLDYEPVLDNDIVPQSKEFLRHESFTERPHWAAHVEEFLHDPERRSGYLLLVGGEGEGKSAFAAHCIQNTIEPVFHFVRRPETEPGWANPERMLRSLTAQLVRKYGVDINQTLLDRLSAPRSDEDPTKAPAEIFADVLERISLVLAAEGEQEVFWIDGLDEAFGPTGRYHDTPGLPGLLPAQLPPGIYAVLTSRPGDHLQWLRDPNLCQRILLEAERETNIADVQRFFTQHANDVDPPLDTDFIARAAARTQGNFYVAVQMLAEIKRNPTAARDPEATPASVKEYHADVYQRVGLHAQRKGLEERDVRLILGLMAEAREPLTPEHLEAFNLPEHAEQILGWAADYFRPRPPQRAPRLPFEFNHISIPEFLSEQLTLGERQNIHARLAAVCLNWRQLDGHARLYALRHLPSHLIAAHMWDELCDVLTDFDYLQATISALPAASNHSAARPPLAPGAPNGFGQGGNHD
jgi:hypothetical protein